MRPCEHAARHRPAIGNRQPQRLECLAEPHGASRQLDRITVAGDAIARCSGVAEQHRGIMGDRRRRFGQLGEPDEAPTCRVGRPLDFPGPDLDKAPTGIAFNPCGLPKVNSSRDVFENDLFSAIRDALDAAICVPLEGAAYRRQSGVLERSPGQPLGDLDPALYCAAL